MIAIPKPFDLGHVVVTPGANQALKNACQTASHFLNRHLSADWGDLCESDLRLNDEAVKHGGQLLSSYRLSTGLTLWIVTEADRSHTVVLMPEEF